MNAIKTSLTSTSVQEMAEGPRADWGLRGRNKTSVLTPYHHRWRPTVKLCAVCWPPSQRSHTIITPLKCFWVLPWEQAWAWASLGVSSPTCRKYRRETCAQNHTDNPQTYEGGELCVSNTLVPQRKTWRKREQIIARCTDFKMHF